MKKFVALAVAGLTLAVGCTGQSDPEPDESPSPSVVPSVSGSPSIEPSPSPSPEPSPSPTSTLSPEQEAAVEAVQQFFSLWDSVGADVEADFQPLADVAAGTVERVVVEDISQKREAGTVLRGNTVYSVEDVGPLEEIGGQQTVRVTVCSDSTDSDLVYLESGESVLEDDRVTHVYWVLDVIYENDYRWAVAEGGSEARFPCP